MNERPWWESAVIYQIYPRSFCDSDGDGVGDLEGIRAHLDHLSWLGVDALWLSPFFPSPMADFGYDVADYTGVDPLFGDLAAFDRLVAEAHDRELKVLIDWVPNHTSDQHAWFRSSRSSRADPKRDWYWWRDDRPDAEGGTGAAGSPGRAPNNWLSAFPGVGGTDLPGAWTWDDATGQWYLHLFLPGQPDLNWGHPEVRAAMEDVLAFWMERGVDGFRVDVAHGLGKDPALPDLAPELRGLPVASINDDPATHPILAGLRSVIDAWPAEPARMMVGEVYLPTTAQVARYYGTPAYPELHLAFNFPPLFAPWDAGAWKACIDEVAARLGPAGAWPTWVLSNHDQPRHRTRYGSEAVARAAAVVLLTLRGTPFVYAGEELGLEDAVVAPERVVDPGGRDGCRAPIPWDATPGHGWAGGSEAWLPWPPGVDEGRTAAELVADPASIAHLYRDLLGARRTSDALRAGDLRWRPQGQGVLCYERISGDDRRLVAVNFTADSQHLAVPDGPWVVEVASDGSAPGSRSVATLRGHQALLLGHGHHR
ncbi:MAG: alpha-amylase family glycosyl hydrolase [Actinomycetota bacterium]|nr:alpha-amylase family glycosyl hydrolase [Actinomycetota bacterium]